MTWLSDLFNAHPVVAALVFVGFRALAIIVAPIPGAALDIPAVSLFGWKQAFVLSEAGTMIGAICNFLVARRLQSTRVGRFITRRFHLEKVQQWERVLPPRDKFLAWIALRLPTNFAFDYISYAAGLTKCTFGMFFWTTLIGNIPVVLVFFFLAGVGFEQNALAGWLLPIVFLMIFSLPVALHLRRKIAKLPPPD